MSMVVMDSCLVLMAKAINNVGPFTIKLFGNDWTPGPSDVLADYTELVANNYSSQNFGVYNFGYTLDSSNHQCLSTISFTWNLTGPAGTTIYGYYIQDQSSNFWYAERFGTPIVLPSTNYAVVVPLTIINHQG